MKHKPSELTLELTIGSFEDLNQVLLNRDALAGILVSNAQLRDMMEITQSQAHLTEFEVLLQSSKMYRRHKALQQSLTNVTYLTGLLDRDAIGRLGLGLEDVVKSETASLLWDRGETSQSVKMLQNVLQHTNTATQSLPVGRAGLLAELVRIPSLFDRRLSDTSRPTGFPKLGLRSRV